MGDAIAMIRVWVKAQIKPLAFDESNATLRTAKTLCSDISVAGNRIMRDHV